MNEPLQYALDHPAQVVLLATILAAILPQSSNPKSVWGRLRKVLDLVAFNVGNARNAPTKPQPIVVREDAD